jgi:hypothetical protein
MYILRKIIAKKFRQESSLDKQLGNTAVLVASMGRCGSTMMYNSFISHGFKDTVFLESFKHCFIYANGSVYKTHGYPPRFLPCNVKLIYIFGNPMDIVISTNSKINWWGKTHHRHLGSGLFRENNDLFIKDTLQLHKHFESWYRPQKFEFLSIKYESLFCHNTREILNEFLGFDFQLPPKINRTTDWTSHPRKEELIRLYGLLNKKIMEADDIKIWKPV